MELTEREELLLCVNNCAQKLNIPFLVIGATARDFLLSHYDKNIASPSSTLDVDIACRVDGWTAYNKLYQCLIKQEEISLDKTMMHRLLFRDKIPLDLLPFGLIGDDNNQVVWPGREDIELSVIGFEDAYISRISIWIADEMFSVACFAALVWLKLSAWCDNKSRTKDLLDIWFIIDNYLELIPEERIYAEDGIDRDIFDDENFSTMRAGARLLGRDIRRKGGVSVRKLFGNIMKQSGEPSDNFVMAMTKVAPSSINSLDIIDMLQVLCVELFDV
ncbi:MAG TPA: nucleotidyl transferase AbiEii/AbiGii toxin family protein [Bacteroidales bacterium]|nr:nucleotidyl transferase AbiEii/AbiGii toxin family protein [Bacteroidales bacterium]